MVDHFSKAKALTNSLCFNSCYICCDVGEKDTFIGGISNKIDEILPQ